MDTKNLLKRGYIDPENVKQLTERNKAHEVVHLNEDQRKVLELKKDIARRMKSGEEVPGNKLLQLNLIYGMKNMLEMTKEHGFEKVTSQTSVVLDH